MTDLSSAITSLRRPSLLVHTAKLALERFKRETTLDRIFGFEVSEDPKDVLMDLYEAEIDINEQRKTGDATYSIARHISVLTALMHEAQSLAQSEQLST
ncbi:MAG: DUF6477 family protein [Paracoccaceae bacterium]|nr:DUF6477 family protein [Paracoccaceae bacterium]MDG2259091.1 DUF6477 family protein [Paracoccaceae bacterium]